MHRFQMHFDASAADNFLKHCGKRTNCSLPQCFQLFSIIILSLVDILDIFASMFSKSSAAILLYVGKGYRIQMGWWHVIKPILWSILILFFVNPFLLANEFWHICSRHLLKTLRKKKKVYFPHGKITLIYRDHLYFCRDINIDVCCRVVYGKGLTISLIQWQIGGTHKADNIYKSMAACTIDKM